MKKNKRLPVIPIKNTVLFPKMKSKINLETVLGKDIYDYINPNENYLIGLTLKENQDSDKSAVEKLYTIGTLLKVESIQPSHSGYLLQFEAEEKIEAGQIEMHENMITAEYTILQDAIDMNGNELKDIIQYLKNMIHEIGDNFHGSKQFLEIIDKQNSVYEVIAYIMPYISESIELKQYLLEIGSLREKSIKFLDMLIKQKENILLQIELAQKFSEKTNANYRKTLLREQLKVIQDELNESDSNEENKEDYKVKIEKAKMPDEVKKTALKELEKLEIMGPNNPEYNMVRNYLDLLVALPWITRKKTNIDIIRARQILDSHHFGLEKVKERIIQHLAVMKLKQEKQGSILLLVGPPGTGKTSLGKSIAEALERKYERISLGGSRDEAQLRGHRRTYIGALPGSIIQGIKKAGEKNPVFVLDEVDKLTQSYIGDPASALLEVLDPEQNNTFTDHYLDVPYDLSEVFFIATANNINAIPAPLLDRMEVIQISSYTNNEKFYIGKNHLLAQTLEEHGLTNKELEIEDQTLKALIENYTMEAGVRGLKNRLSELARIASEKIVTGKTDLPFRIQENMLLELLGKKTASHDNRLKENVPGVVTGLAWTPVGGEILFIEATFMEGNGSLTLTGQLGDVMKESAKISLSLVRSRLANLIHHFNFTKNDIHIHVPSGATPKDGPSAGIALFTTIASLLIGRSVPADLAMTGEITLRGSVMPVGGIKEKVIAAHRAGIRKIILPLENEKDLTEVPEEVKKELSFVFVEKIEEVIKEALDIDLPKPEILILNSTNHSIHAEMHAE